MKKILISAWMLACFSHGTLAQIVTDKHWVDVKQMAGPAIADGGYHRVDSLYTAIDAQAKFPLTFAKYGSTILMAGQVDWAAIQEAVLACGNLGGKPVYLPPGQYYIDRPIEHTNTPTSNARGIIVIGAGSRSTVLRNYVQNNSLFRITQAQLGQFVMSGAFRDFQISTGGASYKNNGFYFKGAFHWSLDNVMIQNLFGTPDGSGGINTGNGVLIEVTNGDPDSSGQITLRQCVIKNCQGWGIYAKGAATASEISLLTLDNTWIEQCGVLGQGGGGMSWIGAICNISNCGFTINRNYALYNAGPSAGRMLTVERTDFENTQGVHVHLGSVIGAYFLQCQFLSGDSYNATKAVEIDASSRAVYNATFVQSYVRATAANVPFTAFDIRGANASYTTIRDTRWALLQDPQKKFHDEGHRTRIEDSGEIYPYPASTAPTTSLSGIGQMYVPDLNRYKIHPVKITSPGTYTIYQPASSGGAMGKEMIIDIENSVGSSSTVWFSGNWNVGSNPLTIPGNKRKTASFYFNSNVGWVQIGEWR